MVHYFQILDLSVFSCHKPNILNSCSGGGGGFVGSGIYASFGSNSGGGGGKDTQVQLDLSVFSKIWK